MEDIDTPRVKPAPVPPWFAILVAAAVAAGIAGAVLFALGRFALGGLGLLLGVALLRWPLSIWAPHAAPDVPPRRQRLGLIAVCAVAAFFRFYRLEPPGLWGDDAINGLLALDVLDGKIPSPFALVRHAFSGFHALTNFLIAGAFWLCGPSLFALRLPGVVANLLCVPLLYGIASPLFGPRTALVAALLFACSPFQLGHAKGLMQNGLGLFFAMLGLCLLLQGALRRRSWCLVLAGAPLALALCTYHSAKLVPLIAAIALWQVWRLRRERAVRLRWAAVGALAVFVISALPAVVSYAGQPEALTGRLGATGVWDVLRQGNWRALWDSLWRTLAVFHYQQGPIYHWFGIGFDPGLTVITAALVLHGLLESLRRWRLPRHCILLSWLMVGLIPGFLSTEAPRGYRVLIATPPLYVWAALPLARLIAMARPPAARALRALVMAVLVAIPLVDFNYYFYRVYSHGLFRLFQADQMVEMARALRGRGANWVGYLLADTFDADYESLRFLRRIWQLDLRDAASLADVIPVRDTTHAGTLLLLSRGTLEAAALLTQAYPRGRLDLHHDPPPRSWWLDRRWPLAQKPPAPPVTFAEFAISREMAARAPATEGCGLSAEYTSDDRSLRRVEPFPYYFFFRPTLPGVYAARWRGHLHVSEPSGMHLEPESDRPPTIEIDGRRWTPKQLLPPGPRALDISIASISGPLRLRLYWRGPDGARQLIPPDAFTPDLGEQSLQGR
jgi:4-amino-4-deoxy-L-arabinose transferase-like glycosyltransferase